MSRRVVVLAAALLLAACARPAAVPAVDDTAAGAPAPLPVNAPQSVVQAVVADQPLPEAVETASNVVQAPVLAAVEALEAVTPTVAPPPPADEWEAACRRAAAALIIRWEVTSEARYTRALRYPVWPGGASGVTWGIGYDGGHQTRSVIVDDWLAHAHRDRLGLTAGITGNRVKSVLAGFRDIETAYPYASQVFEDRSLIEYLRRTERAFGRDDFRALRPNACAALVSLVYNRGAAMTGDSRREMRNIRDQCVPAQDHACIAKEIRAMTRLWRGTVNEKGLSARRESEARLAETP